MIDPQAREVLDELQAGAKPMPVDQAAWLKGYRAELETVVAMQGSAPAMTVTNHEVETADRTQIGLRVYRPAEAGAGRDPDSGLWPTLLFIHGGGFVAGSLGGYDKPLRLLAARAGWQIATVDYRLAPDHPFPAAPRDCIAALSHILRDAALAVDPNCVAVGGDSAGGCLAAVIARHARDAAIPLRLQILLYPNTDLREETPYVSRKAYDGVIIRLDELYRSLALYLGDTDRTLPAVSPGLAPDLEGLCPALLVTNEYDPLRDEAEAYGARLAAAGVSVRVERQNGMIHTALQRGARLDRGDALIQSIATALKAEAGLRSAALRA